VARAGFVLIVDFVINLLKLIVFSVFLTHLAVVKAFLCLPEIILLLTLIDIVTIITLGLILISQFR